MVSPCSGARYSFLSDFVVDDRALFGDGENEVLERDVVGMDLIRLEVVPRIELGVEDDIVCRGGLEEIHADFKGPYLLDDRTELF